MNLNACMPVTDGPLCTYSSYMTGFAKTIPNHARNEMYNIVATLTSPETPTHSYRWSGFHRQLFSDPVNPRWCTTRPVEPLGGFNKGACTCGATKLLPTTV